MTEYKYDDYSLNEDIEERVQLFEPDNTDIAPSAMLRYACMGTVLVSCSPEYEGVLEVPEGVEILASNCFRYCTKLTGIIIPSTLKVISRDSFRNTSSLSHFTASYENQYFSTSEDGKALFNIEKTILIKVATDIEEYVVPETVITIRNYAFHRSKALKKIYFSNNTKEILSCAFQGCTSLSDVSFPDSVTKIGRCSFEGCKSLKSVIIPSQVKKCSRGSFAECTSLNRIELPEGIKVIEDDSFAYCVTLREIRLPSTVKKIDSSAFQGCENLAKIVVDENNAWFSTEDNCLYDKYQTALIRCSSDYETFIAPELLSYINPYAFSGCMKLQKVFLPMYLLRIEDYTFANCENLDTVDIPDNVIAIKKCAFENCKNLVTLNIGEYSSLKKIGDYAFAGCEKLEKISLPDSVLEICDYDDSGGGTFSGCISLKEISIPPKVNYLNESIFYNCKSLTKVKLPYGLEYLDKDVFYGCDNIKTVVLRNTNTKIEEETFPKDVEIIVEESQLYNKIMFE
ncbi:MAG: leucine-rich repeat domain-containing protein [Bacteroidales bacterium]|nr:leucine-rich repeat domain-containing protein [Bacteroidales bacterium]